MARAHVVRWRGEGRHHGEAVRLLERPGDAAIVVRGQPRWLLLSCPCGCAESISLNLDPRTGPAWRLYRRIQRLTVYPSVWRPTGCESHFIIWDDRISWVDDHTDHVSPDADLLQAVRKELSAELRSYVDLADRLDAVPWDVLRACRHLVKTGEAVSDVDGAVWRFAQKRDP